MGRKERLKEVYEYVRKNFPVHTQADFSEKLRYNRAYISSAMNGNEKNLTDKLFTNICEVFPGVFNLEYLLTGEGELLLEKEKEKEAPQPSHDHIDQGSMVNAIISAYNETIDSYKLQLEQERRIQQLDIMRLESRIHDLEDKIAMQKEIIDSLRQQLGTPPKNTGQYPYGVAEKHNQ